MFFPHVSYSGAHSDYGSERVHGMRLSHSFVFTPVLIAFIGIAPFVLHFCDLSFARGVVKATQKSKPKPKPSPKTTPTPTPTPKPSPPVVSTIVFDPPAPSI